MHKKLTPIDDFVVFNSVFSGNVETITFHGEITATDVMPLDQEEVEEEEEMMMVRLQQHSVSALIWSKSDKVLNSE